MNQIKHGDALAKDATLNRFRHYVVSGHAKMTPRQTIATTVSASKGGALYGYNIHSEASVISVWRFAAADLRNALFSGIESSYAIASFYDAEHANVAKLLINGVHYVTSEGYCVADIINIGVGGKSTTAERLFESYRDGVEGVGILTGDNELAPELKFDLESVDLIESDNLSVSDEEKGVMNDLVREKSSDANNSKPYVKAGLNLFSNLNK